MWVQRRHATSRKRHASRPDRQPRCCWSSCPRCGRRCERCRYSYRKIFVLYYSERMPHDLVLFYALIRTQAGKTDRILPLETLLGGAAVMGRPLTMLGNGVTVPGRAATNRKSTLPFDLRIMNGNVLRVSKWEMTVAKTVYRKWWPSTGEFEILRLVESSGRQSCRIYPGEAENGKLQRVQSFECSISQSINQSINQSTNQSIIKVHSW